MHLVDPDIEGAGKLMITDVLTTASIELPREGNARYLIYRRPGGTLINETGLIQPHFHTSC